MAEVAHGFARPGHRLPVRELNPTDVNGEGIGEGYLGGRSKRAPLRPKTLLLRTMSTGFVLF